MNKTEKYRTIIDTLHDYRKHLESQGHTVYAVMLKGSQNYNLDDDESDIDANAIIIPTLADLRKNESYKYTFPTGEITCHNIYTFAEIVAKGNPQWIEVCQTKYKIGKSLDMFKNYKVNPSALKGMTMEKVHAFSKLYPSRASIVEKYGYDPKQLHHIIRLVDVLESGENVVAYEGNERERLIAIKRGSLPIEAAGLLKNDYIKRLDAIYEEKKLTYEQQPVDYETLDNIVMHEYISSYRKGLL